MVFDFLLYTRSPPSAFTKIYIKRDYQHLEHKKNTSLYTIKEAPQKNLRSLFYCV
ncbi:hypothetical protein M107_3503 [Bacteroides fragilis str. 3725 D9(v)]|nr:hypothetical protein M107_3503 [Bacteroides fragilis str. 3725 D9(v)]